MKIAIVTTGGTIDKVYFDAKSTFQVGESHVPEILRQANVDLEWEVVQLLRKDSLDMTDEDRAVVRRIVESRPEKRILVTHGTDTMADTARFLLGIAGKVIVLTGSLAPARFKWSEAEFNVGMAFAALQTLPDGVWIAMNGRIFPGNRVRKNRELNRFEEIPPA
jgi:L-asparaginase